MKCLKKIFFIFSAVLLSAVFFSCKTLQEDVLVSSEVTNSAYEEIKIYENYFISLDAAAFNGNSELENINEVIEQIHSASEEYLQEPAFLARLTALEGLLYNLDGKQKKAQNCFTEANKYQSSDTYVILLGLRISKNEEQRLSALNELISVNNTNGLLLLEKGKLLYKAGLYKEAVAALDNAFLCFENENKAPFHKEYSSIRDSAWELYSLGSADTSLGKKEIPLTKEISLGEMLSLTQQNGLLLESFTGGKEMSVNDLQKRLYKAGYFSAATDQNGSADTASQITDSSSMTRILCARFLWNLFIQKNGSKEMLTKYSVRYSKKANAVSPVPDVDITNPDFDAVLGTIENEIIDLPDGKNFFPQHTVTAAEYLKWLQSCNN